MVKNVTGYDLCKLLAGSWGTLRGHDRGDAQGDAEAESERTLVLRGLDDVTANQAMTAALGSPYDVSGAAHLPDSALRPATEGVRRLVSRHAGQAVTLVRLEGIAASVAHRADSLRQDAFAIRDPWKCCGTMPRRRSWGALRDVEPFAADGALGRMAGVADRLVRRPRAARSARRWRAKTGGERDLLIGAAA